MAKYLALCDVDNKLLVLEHTFGIVSTVETSDGSGPSLFMYDKYGEEMANSIAEEINNGEWEWQGGKIKVITVEILGY